MLTHWAWTIVATVLVLMGTAGVLLYVFLCREGSEYPHLLYISGVTTGVGLSMFAQAITT